MKKKLAFALLFIASIFSFNSCDLEMKGTYTFAHRVEFVVDKEDKEKQDALKAYFTSVLDMKETFTYSGAQSDAIAYGITILEQTAQKFEKAAILDIIDGDDLVIYSLTMSGEKVAISIGGVSWSHQAAEENGNTGAVSYSY